MLATIAVRPWVGRLYRLDMAVTAVVSMWATVARGVTAGLVVSGAGLAAWMAFFGASAWQAAPAQRRMIWDSVVPPVARRAVRAEISVWRTFVDLMPARRRLGFGYQSGHGDLALAVVFSALCTLEAVVVGLFIPRSLWVLAVAVTVTEEYGAVWILSRALAFRAYPHLVTPTQVRLRLGWMAEVDIDPSTIETVTLERGSVASGTRVVLERDEVALAVSGEVNLCVKLARPVHVRRWLLPDAQVSTVRAFADDAAGFVEALEEFRRR